MRMRTKVAHTDVPAMSQTILMRTKVAQRRTGDEPNSSDEDVGGTQRCTGDEPETMMKMKAAHRDVPAMSQAMLKSARMTLMMITSKTTSRLDTTHR